MNPALYLFDHDLAESTGLLQVKYSLPYSDERDLDQEIRERLIQERRPLEYSHTLEDQIGGQLSVGFLIAGLFEDRCVPGKEYVLEGYMPTCIATRALKT